jgi:hypothetical protein
MTRSTKAANRLDINFGIASLPGSPLRNRTVDLLLTISTVYRPGRPACTDAACPVTTAPTMHRICTPPGPRPGPRGSQTAGHAQRPEAVASRPAADTAPATRTPAQLPGHDAWPGELGAQPGHLPPQRFYGRLDQPSRPPAPAAPSQGTSPARRYARGLGDPLDLPGLPGSQPDGMHHRPGRRFRAARPDGG